MNEEPSLTGEETLPVVAGAPCAECDGTGCMYWRINADEYDMDACDECGGTGVVAE